MGKIYDLSYEDVKAIMKDIISNNEELKDWCQKDDEAKDLLESLFYIKDIEMAGKEFDSDQNCYYGVGTKASLYLRDTRQHICAKDMVIDFIKIFFSRQVWESIKRCYCQIKGFPCESFKVSDIYIIVSRIKAVIINNVVKLSDENFCFYLLFITHFREHATATIQEILDWIPDFEKECCWNATDWKCDNCKGGKCILKGKEDYKGIVEKQLEKMIENKILLRVIGKSDSYKINY